MKNRLLHFDCIRSFRINPFSNEYQKRIQRNERGKNFLMMSKVIRIRFCFYESEMEDKKTFRWFVFYFILPTQIVLKWNSIRIFDKIKKSRGKLFLEERILNIGMKRKCRRKYARKNYQSNFFIINSFYYTQKCGVRKFEKRLEFIKQKMFPWNCHFMQWNSNKNWLWVSFSSASRYLFLPKCERKHEKVVPNMVSP